MNEGKQYLEEDGETMLKKGKRNAAIMGHRALWNYNRSEVVRVIWKGVMVQGLPFGNAVLCVNSEVLASLAEERVSIGIHHRKECRETSAGHLSWLERRSVS